MRSADLRISRGSKIVDPVSRDEVHYDGRKKIHSLDRIYQGKIRP